MKLLIASRNRDKVEEIEAIIKEGLPRVEIYSLLDFPNVPPVREDSLTILENAIKKAKNAFQQTGIPSISDDTGLSVDALHGMPGVFSSRFAGEEASYDENVEKLLALLEGRDFSKRRAKFITVAAYYDGRMTLYYEGEVIGFIIKRRRGRGGFGYDPIFLYPPLGRTFAEIPRELKNRISHRYRAFSGLIRILKERYESCNSRS